MNRKKMLVVDDSELNRQILRLSFSEDFSILEASDGQEALKIMAQSKIDAVITDIFMEPMNGYELIRHIRSDSRFSEIPIVAITEHDAASQELAMEAGADEFVCKPFLVPTLRNRVRHICSGRETVLTEQLRESEASLRAAVRHTNLYYWEYDLETDTATFGDKMLEDFSVSRRMENFPQAWLDTGNIHPDDVEEYRQKTAQVRAGTPYVEWECRCRDGKTGEFIWTKVYYTVLCDAQGTPVKGIATAQIIQDLKEMERNFIRAGVQNGIQLWELDLQTRRMTYMGGINKDVMLAREQERVPESMIEKGLYHKDSVPTVRQLFSKIYAGARYDHAEVRAWSEEKQDFSWFNITISAVDDGNGRVNKAICTIRDISNEKHLQRLYEDEQVFRQDLSNTLITVCQVNISRNLLESILTKKENVFSPELRTLTDYRQRMALFLDEIDLSPEENERFSPRALFESYQAGRNTLESSYMARKKGTQQPVWVEVSCHLVCRPETNEIIAFFYNNDSTNKYINAQITQSVLVSDYDFAGLIFATSGHIHVLSSRQGVDVPPAESFQSYEAALERFTSGRLVCNDVENAVSMLSLSTVMDNLSRNQEYVVELDYRENDGEIRKKRWKFTCCNAHYGIYSISRTDIEDIVHAQRKKQEELTKAVQAAEKANSIKSEFLARMSHEIRTPLNGVIGLTSLALDEEDPAVIREYLDKIKVSGKHLEKLVSDVLDMSKIESGSIALHPAVYVYDDFMKNVEALVIPLCEQKNISFVTDISDDHYPIMADSVRFNQIFFNILSNAVKFTPEHGSICFTYRNRRQGDRLTMNFTIRDTGIGMSPAFQKHMFEPFSQESTKVTAATQGTGLGLGIAKALTERMGGTIAVESAPGEGTAFHIELTVPVADAPNIPMVPVPGSSVPDFDGKTVLVAEDHVLNRMIVETLLQKKHATVLLAANGQEALDLFSRSAEREIDAILMDIRMPIMDGLEACQKIRALPRADSGVPIIAMTANAYDEDRQKSKESGMNYHISKPIDTEKLLETLAEFFGEAE